MEMPQSAPASDNAAALPKRPLGADPMERRALLDGLRRQVRALESPSPRWGGVTLGAQALQGLARGAVHEASPGAYLDGPAAAGFALMLGARAMTQTPGGVVIVWGPGAGEFGAPYAPGLAAFGIDAGRALFVRTRTPTQTLAALEEAARTPGLSAVIGCAPARLAQACGRRLARAAEEAGAFMCLWRGFAACPLEGARTRWRVAAAASVPPLWAASLGARAPPGAARFSVAALKGRSLGQEAIWEWQGATHGFHPSPAVASTATHPRGYAQRA